MHRRQKYLQEQAYDGNEFHPLQQEKHLALNINFGQKSYRVINPWQQSHLAFDLRNLM